MTDNIKDKQKRSPEYPFISLPDAVERTTLIYKNEGINAASREVIARHWGYSASSSAVNSIIATLKKYGLVDEHTASRNNLKLTDLALDIVMEPDSEKSKSALKVAARMPRIFNDLLNHFDCAPSNSNLESYLIREKNFTIKAVKGVIKNFKDTISFANLEFGVKINEELKNEDKVNPIRKDMQTIENKQHNNTYEAGTANFPLLNGDLFIKFPSILTQDDLDLIGDYLEIFKKRVTKAIQKTNSHVVVGNDSEDESKNL